VTSLRAVLLSCTLLASSGCALHYNARTLGVPVTMAEAMASPVAGDSFKVTARAIHVFWGLSAAKEPSLQQVLANQVAAGSAVHGLAITSRKRWSDLLITGLTLGFVSTTSVTYSGVISRAGP
jgi:hypothetical protein